MCHATPIPTTITLLLVAASHAWPTYYGVAMCPYSNASGKHVWKGVSTLTGSCPAAPFAEAPQSIILGTQHVQRVSPSSGIYILSFLRKSTITRASVTFSITDAEGKSIARKTVTLGDTAASLPSVNSRHLLKGSSGGGVSWSGRSATRVTRSWNYRSSPSHVVGRVSSGRSYGYTSSSLCARYPGGVTTTSYGYTGHNAVSRGSRAYWIMPLHHHSHHHSRHTYDHCAANNAPISCNAEFTQACETTVSGLNTDTSAQDSQTKCPVTVGSALTRDDLMDSAFSLDGVKLPLNVTIWHISSTGGAMAKYDIPILLSLSEVDVNQSSLLPCWIILVIVVGFCTVCCCCCWCRECNKVAPPSNLSGSLCSKVTCPNGHPLVCMGHQDCGWACDNLKEPDGCLRGCTGFYQSASWIDYRCNECEYDLCDLCVERALQKLECNQSEPHIAIPMEHANATTIKKLPSAATIAIPTEHAKATTIQKLPSAATIAIPTEHANAATITQRPENKGMIIQRLPSEVIIHTNTAGEQEEVHIAIPVELPVPTAAIVDTRSTGEQGCIKQRLYKCE